MKVILTEEQYKRVILNEWFKKEIGSFQDYEDYRRGTDTNIIVYDEKDNYLISRQSSYGEEHLLHKLPKEKYSVSQTIAIARDISGEDKFPNKRSSSSINEGWYDEEDTYYSGDYPDKSGKDEEGEKLAEKIMLVRELEDEIDELMSVIPYTQSKDEAYDIQEDIFELEDRVNGLQWEIENNM